jgi:hypothetical protein
MKSIALVLLLTTCAVASTFSFAVRGRTYTVTTVAEGVAFSKVGHWLYQPSVILPSPQTNNQYVMLITRNLVQGVGHAGGSAITMLTSSNGINFSNEVTLATNTTVGNLCDIILTRPIWDGATWHVYIQALEGLYSTQACGPTNHVFEARGTLSANGLEWVKTPGTNNAARIINGTGVGIGEDLQALNPSPYGISGWPFMLLFNNWGYGNQLFSYLAQNPLSFYYWYGPENTPYYEPSGFFGASYYPDAILANSLDQSTKGHPGIGFESHCYAADRRFTYGKAIAYFENPSNIPLGTPGPRAGHYFPGPLAGVVEDAGRGPRMFRPRVARDPYGYIPVSSATGSSRTWTTKLYYTGTQVNISPIDDCDRYTNWASSQNIHVTSLTITEQ